MLIPARQASNRRTRGLLAVALGVWCWGASPFPGASQPVVAGTLDREAMTMTVQIRNRRFLPHVVTMRLGHTVRLVLENHDAELHAFVPVDLLTRTNVQVAGNGAPQFGEDGFRRVLIPAHGRAELVFVSRKAGAFPFFCDLPGHMMNGTIVVDGRTNVLE